MSTPFDKLLAEAEARAEGRAESPQADPIKPPPPIEPENKNWQGLFLETHKPPIHPIGCSYNAQLIFTHDKGWKNIFAFDTFIGDIVARRPPPWPNDMRPAGFTHNPALWKIGDFSENDVRRARNWIAKKYKINMPVSEVQDAIHILADLIEVHPVRAWFDSLEWDGEARLDTWLIDLAGAVDDEPGYVREVGKNFLIGAVARIFAPGCQLDTMPIFEGPQGAGKTSMVKIIGGEWFLSSNIDIGSKDAYQLLKRKWLVEIGELGSLSRAEVDHVKQYVSQSTDTYRASYAKKATDHPRQCAFVGTMNPEEGTGYLKDNTGARRFQPVRVGATGPIKLEEIARLREQLIAEAVTRYKKGEAWHITDPALLRVAAVVAEARRQEDPWEGMVAAHLKTLSRKSKEEGITTLSIIETLFPDLERSRISKVETMKVANALRVAGWVGERETVEGITQRVFRPGEGPLKLVNTSSKTPSKTPSDTSDASGKSRGVPPSGSPSAKSEGGPPKKVSRLGKVSKNTP
jgi:putative DNA primase/helicase